MTNELKDLCAQLRTADYVLNLMEECDADYAALMAQRDHCRELRDQINVQCPDKYYDPNLGNIVTRIA